MLSVFNSITVMELTYCKPNSITVMELINSITVMELINSITVYSMSIPSR